MTGPRELPHVALSAFPHDRRGVHRTDDAWLDDRWRDPSSRVLLVAGSRVRPEQGRLVWLPPEAVPAEGTRVLLGERDGRAYFAVLLEPAEAPGERDEWHSLRSLLPALHADPDQGPLLLHAVGLAEWHRATRFCPRCGGGLRSRAAGHQLVCEQCERPQFPRTDPAVIMLVTSGEPGTTEERCLLGRSTAWPPERYSTLAGFVEPGETMEDAVRREVAEETGVAVGTVTYRGSQPWPLPASLMVGFHARVADDARAGGGAGGSAEPVPPAVAVDGHEVADARWFTRAELHAQASSGALTLPGGVSISRSLIEEWYGEPLPGSW